MCGQSAAVMSRQAGQRHNSAPGVYYGKRRKVPDYIRRRTLEQFEKTKVEDAASIVCILLGKFQTWQLIWYSTVGAKKPGGEVLRACRKLLQERLSWLFMMQKDFIYPYLIWCSTWLLYFLTESGRKNFHPILSACLRYPSWSRMTATRNLPITRGHPADFSFRGIINGPWAWHLSLNNNASSRRTTCAHVPVT